MSKLSMWAAKKVVQFKHRDEEAQGLAEYGLILALIAVVCIAALTLLGGNIATMLNTLAAAIVP
ncbi:MAG TPA: Flp family type IVb pilin [Tepidiformaceae bacterium]